MEDIKELIKTHKLCTIHFPKNLKINTEHYICSSHDYFDHVDYGNRYDDLYKLAQSFINSKIPFTIESEGSVSNMVLLKYSKKGVMDITDDLDWWKDDKFCKKFYAVSDYRIKNYYVMESI